ncbi:MAG TPA: hypothetical protein DCW90_00780 [Lachnospiraceae bacterium]|nr:MYG1 family protein [uncultured Lachnoclostridium sp.]HAU84099.1 hypothetical protein [Lachnospiraceae bacterium]
MKRYIDIERGFTHSGKFHADDVFSAALLTILNPDIKIERGFEVPENFDGIVFDIGFGEYDHHQQDRAVRENNIPYAAFGLLWRKFGTMLVGEEEAKRFDEKFIQGLDLNDNTGADSQLAEVIGKFNPPWDYSISSDKAFEEAKQVAYQILVKEIEYIKSINRAEDLVTKALSKCEDGILIMPRSAPWKKFVKEKEVYFVVAPSNRGGYTAQAVPRDEKPNELKIPFPEAWRGVEKESIGKVSGVETLQFCHNSGFLISALTKEDAIKACKIAKEGK